MPRNGAGTYSLPAGNPVIPGTVIATGWANTTLPDIGTALTNSVAKDGQTVPTANLPMGGFRHTNVGNALFLNQYTSATQLQNSSLNWLTAVAGVDNITASSVLTPAAYAAGQTFSFQSAGANTTAVTLDVSGLGVKNVTKNGTAPLIAGDIAANAIVIVQYDGTRFQLVGGVTASSTPASGNLSGALNFNQVSISAATTSNILGAGANSILLTGNSPITITSFGTSTQAGAARFVTSTGSGAHVLTNSASLILPGGANITVAQGDSWIVIDEGSDVARVVEYTRAASGTTCTLLAGTSANNLVQLNGSAQIPAVDGSLLTNVVATGTTSAKAWVNFNGTGVVAIRKAFNVSSITDNGTGDYTVNTSISDANYSAVITISDTGTPDIAPIKAGTTPTSTTLDILAFNSSTGMPGDTPIVNVIIFD